LTVKKNHNFFANQLCVHNCDYLDEVFVILMNLGEEPFVVHTGDRIAQAVLKKVEHAEFEVVENFSDAEKDRGGGLGSTGV
jgi:dUTP pyrophosphatase